MQPMSEPTQEKRDHGGALNVGLQGLAIRTFVPLVLHVMSVIPLPISHAIGIAVVKCISIIFPATRKLVGDCLRQVVGDDMPEAEFKKLVWENMKYSWARRYVDFAAVPKYGQAYFDKHVTVKGLERYQAAADQGKGVIIVSLHIGSPLIAWLCVLPRLGISAMGGARRIFDKRTSEILKKYFEVHGMRVYWSDFAMEPIMEQLHNKGTVVILADHITSPRGLRVTYLGRDTLMPAGAAITAYRTGAVLIPAFGVRTSANDFLLEFGEPIDVPPAPDKLSEEALLAVKSQYLPFFEYAVRTYTDQWETHRFPWPKSFSEEDLHKFKTDFGIVMGESEK